MGKKNRNKTNKEVKNTEEVVEMENVETIEVEVMNLDDLTIEERKVIQEMRMKKEKKEKSILTKGENLRKALTAKIMESKRNKIIAGVGAGLAVAGAAAAVIALGGSDDEEIIEGEFIEYDEDNLEEVENNETHEHYHGVDEESEEIADDTAAE